MKSKTFLAAVAAVSATGGLMLPTVADAAELKVGHELVSVAVSYADLDLSSAQGQARLDRRVRAAVKQLCRTGPNPSLADHMAERECRALARTSADGEVRLAIAKVERTRRA